MGTYRLYTGSDGQAHIEAIDLFYQRALSRHTRGQHYMSLHDCDSCLQLIADATGDGCVLEAVRCVDMGGDLTPLVKRHRAATSAGRLPSSRLSDPKVAWRSVTSAGARRRGRAGRTARGHGSGAAETGEGSASTGQEKTAAAGAAAAAAGVGVGDAGGRVTSESP